MDKDKLEEFLKEVNKDIGNISETGPAGYPSRQYLLICKIREFILDNE